MPKNLFEDMVRIKREQRERAGLTATPREARTEQYVPVAEPESEPGVRVRPSTTRVKENVSENSDIQNKYASVYEVAGRENKKGTKYTMWFVAGISVLVLLFALSYLFAGAKVVITPKVQNITLQENFSAVKDSSDTELSYDLVVLSGTESKQVVGGTEQDIIKKATGKATIFNNYSAASQNLDINTRLEGSNGKMYMTDTKITVPGKKGTTPGQVTVGIHATAGGAEYNSGPLDFTIFGFKGTPKYTKFTVHTADKTSITGGFTGKGTAVSPADEEAALTGLKATLQAKLSQKASDQIPAGFILFKDAGVLETEQASPGTAVATDGGATITLNGTFYGFLLDEKKLTQKIAEQEISNYDGGEVYIPHMENIGFTLSNKGSALKDATTISFALSGPAKIVWKVDTAKFLTDIVGRSKKDFNQILSTYPSVDRADVTIRPVWKLSFPDKEKDITVTVVEPE